MKKLLIPMAFMLMMPYWLNAQTKNKSSSKTNSSTPAPEINKPKQIPGTENQQTHPEAKLNSALPSFVMITPDRKPFTEKDIPKNHSVIFTLFNPNCDHCILATNAIKSKLDSLPNTTIVFMTFASNLADLPDFIHKSEASNYPNFHVGICQESFILGHFMPSYVLPQMMIYNAKRKLKKIFYETMDADHLVSYLYQP